MKIFFATPTYRGITHTGFLDSLESTVELCKERGHGAVFGLVNGCCYVQEARNKLVKQFLDTDADILFFLDDDISWPAEKALELIEMDDDIVGGIYPLKMDIPAFPAVIHTDTNHHPIVRADGCISAAGVPTGFLKIKREVILKLIEYYPSQEYTDYKDGEPTETLYDLFPQGVRNGRWVGEDYAFCRLWTDIGGQIHIVPDIDFEHAGFTGNYHQFLLNQPRG
jgi:hypothetical protein